MKISREFIISSLLVGIGGALGGVLRVLCNQQNWFGHPIVTTILVNVLGAACLGFLTAWAAQRQPHPWVVLFLKTGIIGGFTTYGTWIMQSLTTVAGYWIIVSLIGTVVVSEAAFWLGKQCFVGGWR